MPLKKVPAVVLWKQFLAHAVHIDWCYHSIHKHSSRSLHAPIGDASSSLRGSTSSYVINKFTSSLSCWPNSFSARSYCPVRLWGRSGHIQTIIHATVGRTYCNSVPGRRCAARQEDGATVTWDVYEPSAPSQFPGKASFHALLFFFFFFFFFFEGLYF